MLDSNILSGYIIRRKTILKLFRMALQKQDNGRYPLEAYIHNLVFPMKSTSEDIDYEKHNLWLIDEKLSYHYYIASDIELYGTKKDYEALQRPDLIVFDRPIAITDEVSSGAYRTVVIFEFKRPMRNTYSNDDDLKF